MLSPSPPSDVESVDAGIADSLHSPTLQSAATQDVFDSVVKGRKSWKLRGGEVVWPPELEAALLEGKHRHFIVAIDHHLMNMETRPGEL